MAGLLLTACGGGTTPLIDYCCVDTLVHNDEGQDLTGLQKRGTISMVWNQSLVGDSVTSRFTLDALFLDYIANQDSVSGGTIELRGVPEGGDAYGIVSVSGNEQERIPPFSASMYVPPPMVMYLEDDDPETGEGEVSTDGTVLLRWEPSSFEESKVRLVLRSRNQDDVYCSHKNGLRRSAGTTYT